MICRVSSAGLFSCYLLAGVLIAGGLVAPPAARAADAAKDPAFSKASATQSFAKGKALFAEGKFKEAERLFKKVRSDTKTSSDKALVDSWLQGTTGGMVLEKLKRLERSGKLKAYDQTLFYYSKYRSTPARVVFSSYLEALRKQIFVTLEDFNFRSRSYSAKYGKTFVNDPRVSMDGTQCLQWKNTRRRSSAALKIKMDATDKRPRKWSGFEQLEFWVNVKVPPRGAGLVVMSGAGQAPAKKKGAKKASKDFFQSTLKIAGRPGHWTRIRIPLSELRKGGNATFASVEYLQIQIPAGARFDFLIDNVALIRKEGAGRTPQRGSARR